MHPGHQHLLAVGDGDGAKLKHPERLVGFHFFNPVAVMPLIEIVRAEHTNEAALATAFALGKALRKNACWSRTPPAFVVNRHPAAPDGRGRPTPSTTAPDATVADTALRPMGLPMTPFTLLAMVGIPVAHHVSGSLHAAFGERFRVSSNLQVLIDNGIKSLWVPTAEGGQEIPESTLKLLAVRRQPEHGRGVAASAPRTPWLRRSA